MRSTGAASKRCGYHLVRRSSSLKAHGSVNGRRAPKWYESFSTPYGHRVRTHKRNAVLCCWNTRNETKRNETKRNVTKREWSVRRANGCCVVELFCCSCWWAEWFSIVRFVWKRWRVCAATCNRSARHYRSWCWCLPLWRWRPIATHFATALVHTCSLRQYSNATWRRNVIVSTHWQNRLVYVLSTSLWDWNESLWDNVAGPSGGLIDVLKMHGV